MNLPFFKLKLRKNATADERIDVLEEAIEKELGRVDKLARERTLLANERTMLAYQRTAISLFLLAVALIQFARDPMMRRLGFLFFFSGIAVITYSVIHFQSKQRRINSY